jgi:hypothetical protein
MVLSSNMVSSKADAFIILPEGSEDAIIAGGELSVTADDSPSIVADTHVLASSTGEGEEESDGEYFRVDYYSDEGEQEVEVGTQVLVA